MSDIINILENNFYERIETFITNLTKSECINTNKIFITDSGLNCDTFNVISKINDTESLNEAIDYFISKNMEFSCWVNPSADLNKVSKALVKKNLKQDETNYAMYADTSKIDMSNLNTNEIEDFEIKIVDNQQKLVQFSIVLAMNWNPLDTNVLNYFDQNKKFILNNKNSILIVGYYKNHPVSIGELFITKNNFGDIYNISTLKDFRNLGFATKIMQKLLKIAFQNKVFGLTLAASIQGVKIYQKLGFIEVGKFIEYKL